MSRGRSKALSRVLGHHLTANPSEGLVEEARMTECDVSIPFKPDDLSELASFRNNPLFEIVSHSEGLRNNPKVTATGCYFCEFQISFHLGMLFHS